MKSTAVKQPNRKDLEGQVGVPQTFKHLIQWKPFLKVTLPVGDDDDFSTTKFAIAEKQGEKLVGMRKNMNTICVKTYQREIILVFYSQLRMMKLRRKTKIHHKSAEIQINQSFCNI